MLSTALQAIEKQKKFTNTTIEEFARVFNTQISKQVEISKTWEE